MTAYTNAKRVEAGPRFPVRSFTDAEIRAALVKIAERFHKHDGIRAGAVPAVPVPAAGEGKG